MPSNVTKLAIHIASNKAIPSGGGFADGVKWLLDPERRKADMKEAFDTATKFIAAIKDTPDNPYGDDDESIAGAILKELEKRNGEITKSGNVMKSPADKESS